MLLLWQRVTINFIALPPTPMLTSHVIPSGRCTKQLIKIPNRFSLAFNKPKFQESLKYVCKNDNHWACRITTYCFAYQIRLHYYKWNIILFRCNYDMDLQMNLSPKRLLSSYHCSVTYLCTYLLRQLVSDK